MKTWIYSKIFVVLYNFVEKRAYKVFNEAWDKEDFHEAKQAWTDISDIHKGAWAIVDILSLNKEAGEVMAEAMSDGRETDDQFRMEYKAYMANEGHCEWCGKSFLSYEEEVKRIGLSFYCATCIDEVLDQYRNRRNS